MLVLLKRTTQNDQITTRSNTGFRDSNYGKKTEFAAPGGLIRSSYTMSVNQYILATEF
jgi:hypothetical protein